MKNKPGDCGGHLVCHRWEEVEKQSFRVKGFELSVGERENRFTLHRNKPENQAAAPLGVWLGAPSGRFKT